MTRYVIKIGKRIVFHNHEGFSKEELKPIRDRMADSDLYDKLRNEPPEGQPHVHRQINSAIVAGQLPYISRG